MRQTMSPRKTRACGFDDLLFPAGSGERATDALREGARASREEIPLDKQRKGSGKASWKRKYCTPSPRRESTCAGTAVAAREPPSPLRQRWKPHAIPVLRLSAPDDPDRGPGRPTRHSPSAGSVAGWRRGNQHRPAAPKNTAAPNGPAMKTATTFEAARAGEIPATTQSSSRAGSSRNRSTLSSLTPAPPQPAGFRIPAVRTSGNPDPFPWDAQYFTRKNLCDVPALPRMVTLSWTSFSFTTSISTPGSFLADCHARKSALDSTSKSPPPLKGRR